MGINISNRVNQYGLVSKILHWLLAISLVLMLGLGLVIANVKGDWRPLGLEAHQSFGLVILLMALFCVGWRFYNKPPPLPSSTPKIIKAAACINFALLYTLMVVMPVLGYAMTNALGKTVVLFGLVSLPRIVTKNLPTGLVLKDLHADAGYLMIGLIILHLMAVLYHHWFLKDALLKRLL